MTRGNYVTVLTTSVVWLLLTSFFYIGPTTSQDDFPCSAVPLTVVELTASLRQQDLPSVLAALKDSHPKALAQIDSPVPANTPADVFKKLTVSELTAALKQQDLSTVLDALKASQDVSKVLDALKAYHTDTPAPAKHMDGFEKQLSELLADRDAEKIMMSIDKVRPEVLEAHSPYRFGFIWRDFLSILRHINRLDITKPVREATEGKAWENFIQHAHTLIEARDDTSEKYLTHRHKLFPPVWAKAKEVARDNTVLLLAFNYGEFNLFLNWLCSCKHHKIDISNLLVYAADSKLHEVLDEMGIANFYLPEIFGEKQSGISKRFGDNTWLPFGQLKMLIPKVLFDGGFDVMFQDVDMIWFKDPLKHIKATVPANVDYAIQSVGQFQRWQFAPYNINSGFWHIKNNLFSKMCWDRMFYSHETVGIYGNSQQLSMNQNLALCSGMMNLKVEVLDMVEYPSGWIVNNATLKVALEHRVQLLELGKDPPAGTTDAWQKEVLGWAEAKRKRHIEAAEAMVLYHTNWTPDSHTKATRNKELHIWFLDLEANTTTDLYQQLKDTGGTQLGDLCVAPTSA